MSYQTRIVCDECGKISDWTERLPIEGWHAIRVEQNRRGRDEAIIPELQICPDHAIPGLEKQ